MNFGAVNETGVMREIIPPDPKVKVGFQERSSYLGVEDHYLSSLERWKGDAVQKGIAEDMGDDLKRKSEEN